MDESIGARLRRAREQRRLTIEEVSEATKVRPHYLEALEGDDLSTLPSTAQARGFLRIYADFLGLGNGDLNPQPQPQDQQASPNTAVSAPAPSGPEIPKSSPSLLSRLRQRISRGGGTGADSGSQDLTHDGAPGSGSDVTGPETKKKSAELTLSSPEASSALDGSRPELPPDSNSASGRPATATEVATSKTPPEVPIPGPADANRRAGARTWNWLTDRLRGRGSDEPRASLDVPELDEIQAQGESGSPDLQSEAEAPPPSDEHPQSEAGAEPETAEQIFAEIGRQLRERREMLSLTHEEIERYTRVRAEFLDGLENGALEELPSPVQTRGILANYASFLDLDSEAILLRFADGLQARHREQKPQWQPSGTRQSMTVHTTLPPLRSFIASDLLFGIGVAVMLLLFSVWGISRVMSVRNSSPARATSVSIAEVLAGTPVATVAQEVTLIPAQDTSAPASAVAALPVEAATLDSNAAVQIGVQASERAYIRVTVDGKLAYEGRTDPNAQYTYQGSDRIEVLVGNASALRITYNGRDLGMMGNFGQVVDRIYTAQGVETPTPTLAPTPTATPHYTATPSQTATPTPSVTPTPKTGG